MGTHSSSSIDRLEKQIQERYEKLVVAMQGREVSKEEMRMLQHNLPHRWVTAGDVRIAVDDFATILKEIKASLGKR
jgi:hypothetical protein